MGDTLDRVTTPVRPSAAARLTALLFVLLPASLATLVAAPAHADVPDGWSEPPAVDNLQALLFLVGGPIVLFVLIALAVYVPAMIRGERLLPDHGAGEAQWLGGPRPGAHELAPAEHDDTRTGGASGSW